ncbi:MAG: putative molybdenum carrier protein [Eubacteriales bacterium]|nr:putative molybdenum carrier protein [Eubacteriales bacterium]
MNTIIFKIRSGGQSGVDRAALDFARKHNIEICGWCPKGGWAEDYPEAPGILAEYPELRETTEKGTAQRTLWNMRDADAILTIVPEGSGASKGTDLGVREGMRLEKPMFTAHSAEDVPAIIAWLRALAAGRATGSDTAGGADGIELCVGGPRASECAQAYRVTVEILEKVFEDGFSDV